MLRSSRSPKSSAWRRSAKRSPLRLDLELAIRTPPPPRPVAGANAAAGGADVCALELRLGEAVDDLVEVEEDVGAVGDEEAAVEVDAVAAQLVDLREEGREVDGHAVAEDADRVGVQNPALGVRGRRMGGGGGTAPWDEVELELRRERRCGGHRPLSPRRRSCGRRWRRLGSARRHAGA